MRARWIVIASLVAAVPVHADGIALEAYTGARPADASRLMSPLLDELGKRGFVSGDALARKYETEISRPVRSPDGLLPDFDDRVERGHKAWVAGKFDEAVSTLAPVVEAAFANPGAFTQNQPLRERLLKALIALALSQQRMGATAAASATFGEILRRFPDTQLSRATYGPDAYTSFEDARRTAGAGGRGRLTVKVSNDSAVVFVDEHFENVGTITKGDLVPGDYWVYQQIGKQESRAHRVAVRANAESAIAIDSSYDAAVHTSPVWTGLAFASATEREKLETKYAAAFAQELAQNGLVIVGIDQVQGRPALVGTLVDLQSGHAIRRASLALEPDPAVDRVRSLARFLAGDEPTRGLVVELRTDTAPKQPPASSPVRSDRRWMKWTGIAALGAGAVGLGLGVKFGLDARAADQNLQRVCAVSCTSAQALPLQHDHDTASRNAIISAAIGGGVIVAGAVLLVIYRWHRDGSRVPVAPSGAVYAFSF